jgi:succinate dehydrogenase / fumarate reductase, cytochrome b subunit
MRPSVKQAPRFLTLWSIRFPIGAIASIGHRVSGVLLLVCLPVLAWALESSVSSPAAYAQLVEFLGSRPMAPVVVIGVWALAHHLFAGIRHLLMDIGVGAQLAQARASAMAALGAGIAVAALFSLWWLS